MTLPRERVIVALDLDDPAAAEQMVVRLQGHVSLFKVGSQLFTVAGPAILEIIRKQGGRVFLDLKYHDIPHTVAAAVRQATRLHVAMLTLHTAGGVEMMRAAAAAATESAEEFSCPRPLLVGVTVLTSLDAEDLHTTLGSPRGLEEQVVHLARLAQTSGFDGVVASPREVSALRAACPHPFCIVTPGIRPPGAPPDDQRRTATAREAFTAGADYIVVGRPLLAALDPVAALDALIADAPPHRKKGE